MTVAVDYKRQIYAVRDLPTLPVIAQRILGLVDDEKTGTDQLARIIASDQTLAVKVLSMGNSAYYGRRAQIGTVKQAIVLIGGNMLKQIALSVLVFKALDRGSKGRKEFWRHSLLAANAASLIAREAGGMASDICFMAGLLHDVGKLVLASSLPVEYAAILERTGGDGLDLVDAEREAIETDHAEVGAWMAERWQLPAALVHAIRFHHNAALAELPHAGVIAAVQAANVCAAAADLAAKETGVDPEFIAVPEGAMAQLRMTAPQFYELVIELVRRSGEIDQFLE